MSLMNPFLFVGDVLLDALDGMDRLGNIIFPPLWAAALFLGRVAGVAGWIAFLLAKHAYYCAAEIIDYLTTAGPDAGGQAAAPCEPARPPQLRIIAGLDVEGR